MAARVILFPLFVRIAHLPAPAQSRKIGALDRLDLAGRIDQLSLRAWLPSRLR
jgi:hypothetical protein